MKFDQAYRQDDFLRFLTTFLPEDFVAREEDIVLNERRCKEIKKANILGICESLDLHVLELEHDKESDPRITITSDAFKILADHWIHKALVIFRSKNSDNYRFSYLSISLEPGERNKITKKYSNARRYSFYLGPNASVNTPNQLLISRGRISNIDDLISRFSVDVVTNEFFNTYRETFFDIVDEFKSNTTFMREVVDKHDIKTTDFVKKLMGQIVFLYFLQRKGWLGVKSGEPWGSGDPRFMRTIFEKCKSNKENFYNDYLEPLFYDCLGKADRGNKGVTNDQSFAPLFNARIPYLNGGLFEDIYDWKKTTIEIRNNVFDDLLSFFDRYNFTIDENTPTDQEVSVDPEMLGKIFENLLEIKDRKSKGTYYTPREIVHYMCRESLVNYLSSSSEIPKERLRKLFDSKDAEFLLVSDIDSETKRRIHSELSDIAEKVDQLLSEIKIVDPAVGSGAFPMGMLSEISSTRYYLSNNFLHKFNANKQSLTLYDIKRETLENCIYGVDLDPGAVEIAKLRFWLSLVVDHNIDEIEALPNLDYKIMQGNSLLEDLVIGDSVISLKFDNLSSVDLRTKDSKERIRMAGQAKLFVEESESVLEDIRVMHAQYFKESDSIKKKELKKSIDSKESDLVAVKCGEEMARLESLVRNSLREKDTKTARAQINQITKTLESLLKEKTRPYFLWHLNFADVFSKKGGFDIVIGNPPYVRADMDEQHAKMRKAILDSELYETLWEKWDLYVAFIERGYKLLRPKGVTSMIVSDAFCHAKYAQRSQNWFLKNSRIIRLDFCSDLQIFDAAVHNLIYFFQRADGAHHMPERRIHRGKFGNITELPSDVQEKLTFRSFFPGELPETSHTSPVVMLENICYISKGMVVSSDEKSARGAFKMGDVVSDKKDPTHPKKFAEGKHLDSWLPAMHKWLEWGTERAPAMFSRPTFTEFQEAKEKILVQRSPGPDPKCCYDDEKIHFTESTVGFVMWCALRGVRNKSLKKVARYKNETPLRQDLPDREVLEKNSDRFSMKYLLGVMNSAVARDFLRTNRRSNIHLYPDDWKRLPIPDVSTAQQKPIEECVEQILLMIRENSAVDVSLLEQKLNQQVNELYGVISDKSGASPT